MVVFVPSYGFLHMVMEKWKSSGILQKLSGKKKVRCFSDYRDVTTHSRHHRFSRSHKRAHRWKSSCATMPQRLRNRCAGVHVRYIAECSSRTYCQRNAADESRKRGALLFAVVGAKLSEGLNFTDDLARAVVIVGLPFANLGSSELKERMDYVTRMEERRASASGGTRPPGSKNAGMELYENMCMNAINQSIGQSCSVFFEWRLGR